MTAKNILGVLAGAIILSVFLFMPHAAMAAGADCDATDASGNKVPGVKTSIRFPGQPECVPIGNGDINNNVIIVILKVVLAFLGGGVGIAAVGGIVYGGFLYMTARADAGQVKKGEEVIRNAVIAILAFLGMAAILNFLVPGGVLG